MFYTGLIILFTACSLKPISLETNTYSIGFKLKNKNFNNTLHEVFIKKPLVSKSFNTHSILYTTKVYHFEEYAINKWLDKPSNMIYTSFFEAIESSKVFKNVYKEKRKNDGVYTLTTEVTEMYNSVEENKSYAILKVKFYLKIDGKNIKTFVYDKKIPLEENNPYSFVVAINKGFENALSQWLFEITKLR